MSSSSWAVSSSSSSLQVEISPAPTSTTSPPEGVVVLIVVGVGVETSLPCKVMTSSGGWFPSREEKFTPSPLSATSAKPYVPSPETTVVTSYSAQLFELRLSVLANASPTRAGRRFQVIPLSTQDVSVSYTAGPLSVLLSLT